MGAKTLYVSDNDEEVWAEARKVAERGESLSRLVADGLRMLLADRSGDPVDDNSLQLNADDRAAIARFAREINKLGWERASRAFTRACIEYGSARSRAAAKANNTRGQEGRRSASKKAAQIRRATAGER